MRGVVMKVDIEKVRPEDLNGVYAEIAQLLGLEAAVTLYKKYRGTQVSFPVEVLSRDYIFKHIKADYNGYNIRELATKYGYTEKWIRRIVAEAI